MTQADIINKFAKADVREKAKSSDASSNASSNPTFVGEYMLRSDRNTVYNPDGSVAYTLDGSGSGGGSNNNGTSGGGTGGGTGGNVGGTSSGGASGGTAQSIYENYMAQILADQQAAAQARQQALTDNYNRALSVLQQNYNNETSNLKNSAEDSLRQAYINYMQNQRGIQQNLASMGINGGATESVLANLYNNYGSNRNNINNQLQKSLGELGTAYNSNVADLANSYGANLASVLSDLYNQAASTKENYANKIASLLASKTSGSGSSGGSSSKSSASSGSLYMPSNLTYGQQNGIESAISSYKSGSTSASSLVNMLRQTMSDDDAYNVLFDRGIDPSTLGISAPTSAGSSSGVSPAVNGSSADTPIVSGGAGGGMTLDGSNLARSPYNRNTALNDIKKIMSMTPDQMEREQAVRAYGRQLEAMYGLDPKDIAQLILDSGLLD